MATEAIETPPKTGEETKRKSPSRKTGSRKAARGRRKASRILQHSADQVLRQGKRAVNKAYDLADDARRAVRMPRRSDFVLLSDVNPLVIGAVGIGIGVVLGSLISHGFSEKASWLGSAKSSRGGRRR